MASVQNSKSPGFLHNIQSHIAQEFQKSFTLLKLSSCYKNCFVTFIFLFSLCIPKYLVRDYDVFFILGWSVVLLVIKAVQLETRNKTLVPFSKSLAILHLLCDSLTPIKKGSTWYGDAPSIYPNYWRRQPGQALEPFSVIRLFWEEFLLKQVGCCFTAQRYFLLL